MLIQIVKKLPKESLIETNQHEQNDKTFAGASINHLLLKKPNAFSSRQTPKDGLSS